MPAQADYFYQDSVKKTEPPDLSFRTMSKMITSSVGSSSENRNKDEFDFDSDEDDSLKEAVAQTTSHGPNRHQFFRYNFDSMNLSQSVEIKSSSSSSSTDIRKKESFIDKMDLNILQIPSD
jgi:hypothetical protein